MMAREMKDSGIEWIGKIPENWDTIKVKYTSWLKGRIGWDGLKSTEYTDVGAYLITGVNFNKGVIDWDSCVHITEDRFHEDSDIHIKENDLLITKDGTIGKVAIAKNCPEMVSLNSGVLLIRNIYDFKYHDKYMYYVLLSDVFWRWYTLSQTGQSTIKHLYQEQFYNFEFTFPPLSEQQLISSYLDRQCGLIDSIIEKTKSTIEEYKKLKQSVIIEAVTKGIRPNREMKDSDIEWIGDIPKEWDIKVAFQLFNQVKNKNEGLVEQNLLSLSYGKIKRRSIDAVGGLLPESFDGYNIIEADDIVLRLTDLQNDHTSLRVGLATERGIVTSAYLTLRNQSINKPSYLYYYLHSFDLCKGFYGMGAGVRQGLNWDGLKLLKIILPSIEEQTEITTYLDNKCTEIDTLIAKKEQIVSELDSYKKSLIYEYVTGKKEVV